MRRLAAAAGLLLLIVFAARGVALGVYYAQQYSQDFQWSPSVLLSEGRDPYASYLDGDPGRRILMSQEPNYLHLLYVLLWPLAQLSWPAAKWVWALANVAMGLAAAVLIAREAGLRGSAMLAAVATFAAASPFAHAIGNGQQSLLVLLALSLSWACRSRAHGGVALAVAGVKYSLALPLGLWLLLERRSAALAAAVATCVGGLLAFAALCGASEIGVVFEPLRVSAAATRIGLADALSLTRALGFGVAAPYLASLVVAAAGVAWLWGARRRLDDLVVFAALCHLSLFSFFHNLYDYVLLLPLFCRALTFPPRLRALVLAYVGFFWFAVQFIDAAPLMKTTGAIAAMSLLSAAVFATVAGGRLMEPKSPVQIGT